MAVEAARVRAGDPEPAAGDGSTAAEAARAGAEVEAAARAQAGDPEQVAGDGPTAAAEDDSRVAARLEPAGKIAEPDRPAVRWDIAFRNLRNRPLCSTEHRKPE